MVDGLHAPLAEQPAVASGIRLLEAWIASRMAYQQLPGLSIGIVHDAELIWARGFGAADLASGAPATPFTLYRIASISKLFTAIAVVQLRDEGRLRLDDPVASHLPSFSIRSPFPDAPPINLRHLLTHTSGLPREADFPYWTDFRFPSAGEILSRLPEQTAVYPPDTKWKYSNLGMAIAGMVVEAVAGEPFEEYVARHILAPLGMTDTGYHPTGERAKRLASGQGRRMPDGSRAPRPLTDANGIAPAAGLASTVVDLAKLAAMQIAGAEDGKTGGADGSDSPFLAVLKPSSVREMHRVAWLSPDWTGGAALGFSVTRRDGRTLVGHNGWTGGMQSTFSISSTERVAVIALMNADDGHPYPRMQDSVVERAFRWIAPAVVEAASPPPAPPEPDPAWERYAGLYRSPWSDSRVMIHRGRLVLIDPNEPYPETAWVALVPTGLHTFRTESDLPFGEDGDSIRFEIDDAGRAIRLIKNRNISDRVREEE